MIPVWVCIVAIAGTGIICALIGWHGGRTDESLREAICMCAQARKEISGE